MKCVLLIFLFNLALLTCAIGGDVVPPKGSVAVANLEELLKSGNELGRAKIVIVYLKESTCPLHNGQLKKWMDLPQLTKATILPVTFSDAVNNEKLCEMLNAGEKKSGNYVPRLYFVDDKGKYLDVIPYKADSKLVKDTLDKYIPEKSVVLTPEDAKKVRALIDKLNKSISEKKTDSLYSDIKKLVGYRSSIGASDLVLKINETLDAFGNTIVEETLKIEDEKKRKSQISTINNLYKGLISTEILDKLK